MSLENLHNEKELLNRVAEGDENAFGKLLTDYYQVCFGTAIQFLRDEWTAEDIVQEVFLKVWLRRKKLVEVDNFGGWLRTVTVHVLYNHIRKSRMEKDHISQWSQELNLPGFAVSESSPEETYFEELVVEALTSLTPRQNQAFILIKKEGYTREEAARIIGISSETVKTHLEQAMRSIRAYCIGRLDIISSMVIFSMIIKKYF